ncbi:hypothetical protein BJ508DRAFT_372505 [Ascobolus immersus RN42]|uniref:Uncharacterized protein n=1 Tax=Ascobolus immersus RN42 TaxID=1160509 RepID=A0A3N4IPU6_ASCIM|nr:hypothetical protein BJ508DRAFT_372505 [Ascobolus immersus RN42]
MVPKPPNLTILIQRPLDSQEEEDMTIYRRKIYDACIERFRDEPYWTRYFNPETDWNNEEETYAPDDEVIPRCVVKGGKAIHILDWIEETGRTLDEFINGLRDVWLGPDELGSDLYMKDFAYYINEVLQPEEGSMEKTWANIIMEKLEKYEEYQRLGKVGKLNEATDPEVGVRTTREDDEDQSEGESEDEDSDEESDAESDAQKEGVDLAVGQVVSSTDEARNTEDVGREKRSLDHEDAEAKDESSLKKVKATEQ